MNKTAPIAYGLLLLALMAAPFLGFYPVFVMKVMCFALFACAFNLLLGYTGLLSFGHAAFLGGSAYVTGHVLKIWGLTPELGLLVGTLFGALLGLAFGWLAIRRQGIYFSMITLARCFGERPRRSARPCSVMMTCTSCSVWSWCDTIGTIAEMSPFLASDGDTKHEM